MHGTFSIIEHHQRNPTQALDTSRKTGSMPRSHFTVRVASTARLPQKPGFHFAAAASALHLLQLEHWNIQKRLTPALVAFKLGCCRHRSWAATTSTERVPRGAAATTMAQECPCTRQHGAVAKSKLRSVSASRARRGADGTAKGMPQHNIKFSPPSFSLQLWLRGHPSGVCVPLVEPFA